MANAKTNFRNSTQRGLQQKVGKFYERLLAKTLRLKRSPGGQPEYADLYSERLDACFEVKARGDSYGLEIRASQVAKLSEERLFPTPPYVVYALAPYRSRRKLKFNEKRPRGISKKTTMVSLFRNLNTDIEFNTTWAANTPVVYLLDLRIIQALIRTNGTILGFYPDRVNEEVLLLNRVQLTRLFRDDDLAKSLVKLDLKSEKWRKRMYPMKVRIRVSKPRSLPKQFTDCRFMLVTVLPAQLDVRIAKVIGHKTRTLK